MSKKTKLYLILSAVLLIIIGIGIWEVVRTPTPDDDIVEQYHTHADFKVYINNKTINFSLDKYQSHEDEPHDAFTHLHDGNGDVIHFHKEGITLGYFFKTIKMEFTKDCFTLDTGEKYCSTQDGFNKLELWVNGEINEEFENYIPQDLDRILITYGHLGGDRGLIQLESVTDKACIYSKTCPERGEPPTENCVKALGVPCK